MADETIHLHRATKGVRMDLAKLAAIAAAATQGRREVDYTQDGRPVILIPDFYKTVEPDRRARVLYEPDWATPEDVQFDATFDPETVLQLVTELQEHRKGSKSSHVSGWQPEPLVRYPEF